LSFRARTLIVVHFVLPIVDAGAPASPDTDESSSTDPGMRFVASRLGRDRPV